MRKPLGIMMLDTTFERPVGDVGNAESWPFPVLYKRIPGAFVRRIVDGQDEALLEAFVVAGRELVEAGAVALTTSCGFLILRQAALAARLPVPIATSSLLQIPQLSALLPAGRKIGVVTYDKAALTLAHFQQAGVDVMPPVVGLPKGGAFHGLIEGGKAYDPDALAAELNGVVAALLQQTPEIGALLFECTNLPPFSRAVSETFDLPVFDSLTLGHWLMSGVAVTGGRPGNYKEMIAGIH